MVEDERISWEYGIPLINNRFMLYDMVKVAVLSATIMWVLVALMGWLIDGEPVLLPWFVPLVGAGALLALFLIACLLLLNRFGVRFEVGPDGISHETLRRERGINRAVTIIGALAGSATTTGAGLLASSQEEMSWAWDDIHRVKFHPGPRVITIMNSWRALERLYCTAEQYPQVEAAVRRYHAEATARRAERAAHEEAVARATPDTTSARKRSLASRLGWPVLVIAASFSASAWPWGEEEAIRIGLLGGVVLAIACAIDGPVRRILAVVSVPAILWLAADVAISALDPFETWDDSLALTAMLDPIPLAISCGSILVLLGIAGWRIFGREPGHDQGGSR